MHKDLKTGLVLGLIVAAFGAIWISTRPGLTTEARVQRNAEALLQPGSNELTQSITNRSVANSVTKTSEGQEYQETGSSSYSSVKLHTVQSGETLSDISYKYYGSSNKWRKIYNANHGVIKNPDVLTPGTKIVIPD